MKKRRQKESLSVMKKYLEQFEKMSMGNSEEVKLLPEKTLTMTEIKNKSKQRIRK